MLNVFYMEKSKMTILLFFDKKKFIKNIYIYNKYLAPINQYYINFIDN